MKRALPYILIALVLLITAGIYLDKSKGPKILGDTQDQDKEEKSTSEVKFKNLGPPPEFVGVNNWINSEPLTMEKLRGKVVLVDFWTYSCINCIRTLPYVTKWYDTYRDKGLVVVGVHTPEFAFEKVTENVATATKRFNINYPVAQDNDYATWEAYNNHYWPAEYLIDKNGNIVYTHFGEGAYDHTENAIRLLLGLEGGMPTDDGQNLNNVKSPEMYFGLNRLEFMSNTQVPSPNEKNYSFPNSIPLNTFALEGNWKLDNEKAILVKGPGRIKLHFNSGKIYMVARSEKPILMEVKFDGKVVQTIQINESKLYNLWESNEYQPHELELYINGPGFEAFTFTFG